MNAADPEIGVLCTVKISNDKLITRLARWKERAGAAIYIGSLDLGRQQRPKTRP
jgi:hypothetical protein